MADDASPDLARIAERAGRRASAGMLTALAAGGVAVIVGAALAFARPAAPAGGRLDARAALVRGGTRLAGIEQRVQPRGRGRLPLYLAPARGPAVDSARVGALAARLVAGTGAGATPVIALVPRDSVRGLPLVARLVVTPGEPGLLVFSAPVARP